MSTDRRIPMRHLASLRNVPRRLLAVGCAAFFAFVSFFVLVAALPLYLEHHLGYGESQVGMVVGSAYLVNVVAYVLVGSRCDQGATRRYLVASAVALAPAGPLFAAFHAVWALALVALWQGLTMSAFVVAATTFAGQLADPARRGAQMGIFGMFTNAAAALAPAAGVALYHAAGPEALFGLSFAAGLVAAALGAAAARGYAVAAEPEPLHLASWVRASRSLLRPAAAVVAMGVPFGVVLAFMPGHLEARGVSNPGLFYSAEIVAQLLLRTTAGSLSDRYGRAPVAGVGLLGLGGSVAALVGTTNEVETVLAGLLAGAGFAAFAPALLAWMFDLTPAHRRGLATASYLTGQDVGRVVGTAGMSPLASTAGGAVPFLFAATVAAGSGLAMVASGLSTRRRRRPQALRLPTSPAVSARGRPK
jgi:MFS family permease